MWLFAWFLIQIAAIITGSTLSDVDNLYTTLIQSHNKNVRPADNQTEATMVNVSFSLVAIQGFDEVNGNFSVVGFLEVTWYDTRMTWDPLEYNNTYSISFSQDDVWKPTLTIINPFSKVDQLGKDYMTVRYFYDGYAYWSPGDNLISLCNVDVTYFPFDEQTCRISLMSWGTMPNEILLKSPLSSFKLGFYYEHGTWDVTSTSSTDVVSKGMSSIKLLTTMKRRPGFYVVNVVLPVMLLMALNSCVFILPSESGERVSYSITVLLAIAVFMTLTSDNLPKTSKPMSLLCYFLMFDLIFSSFICLVTMLGLRLYFKDEKDKVPAYLKWLANCSRYCTSKKATNNAIRLSIDGTKTDVEESNKEEDVSWRDLSKGLDTLLLWISLSGLVLGIILFFAILAKAA
jgi:hypothetical protein